MSRRMKCFVAALAAFGLAVPFAMAAGAEVPPRPPKGAPEHQAPPRATAAARNPLVGTGKPVSSEERAASGKPVTPLDYGPNPVGILMYDDTGHMSVHAMRRGRPRLGSDDIHRATPEQAKAAFVGYNGYFGTYEVDQRAGVVIHHVEGSLIPDWEDRKS